MIASGTVNNIKYIISIDNNQKKDIHIIKSFYGLLDIRYKSIEVLKKAIDEKIINKINFKISL